MHLAAEQEIHMKLGFIIAYVKDVKATQRFYQEAFGLKIRFEDPDGDLYGEMETGSTVLAFLKEDYMKVAFEKMKNPPRAIAAQSGATEIGFLIEDVPAAYARAIKAGATQELPPIELPWGQIVGYVRDLNGILVSIGSPWSSQQ